MLDRSTELCTELNRSGELAKHVHAKSSALNAATEQCQSQKLALAELQVELSGATEAAERESRLTDADRQRLGRELASAAARAATAEAQLSEAERAAVELRRQLRAKHDFAADLETARAEAVATERARKAAEAKARGVRAAASLQ
eukprot:SAG22_NODE_6313_length_872_cov_0.870634_1_plen_144_part_10